MKTIDIVVPTMWKADTFVSALESYIKCTDVGKIIIIDNARHDRPKLPNSSKLEIVSYGRNIYVNPAWNEGVNRATADVVALINDDITVESSLFESVSEFPWAEIDLIGVHLKNTPDNYTVGKFIDKDELTRLKVDKTKPIGGQSYAFGVCMFMRRDWYPVIPSLYQIWFGDDYLVQKADNIYSFKTNRITGAISKTLVALGKSKDIKARMELDARNVGQFDHFENGKNWDLVKQTASVKSKLPRWDSLETEYQIALKTKSDINENLPVLYELAKECKTVVEMGVRTGVSTRAFLNTDVELLSFDIYLDPTVQGLFDRAIQLGKSAQYIKANVLDIEISDTDLLFIDTLHTYEQLKQELALHGNKARKYIAFHDTHTFGLRDEVGNGRKGLLSAIVEFLIENPHWHFYKYKTNNNGMTVLKRMD